MERITERKRLPRRYDTAVQTLRKLAQSKSERVQLAAALRLSEIFLEFDRAQERIAIAVARAEARKAEVRAEAVTDTQSSASHEPQTAEQSAARFLDGLRQRGVLSDAD